MYTVRLYVYNSKRYFFIQVTNLKKEKKSYTNEKRTRIILWLHVYNEIQGCVVNKANEKRKKKFVTWFISREKYTRKGVVVWKVLDPEKKINS